LGQGYDEGKGRCRGGVADRPGELLAEGLELLLRGEPRLLRLLQLALLGRARGEGGVALE